METILTNARLVLEDRVLDGTLTHEGGVIREIVAGRSHAAGAIDCEGDVVAAGLIEVHTDNLEKHFVPRPGVIWPNPLAAALVHDVQMAAAGVTTVCDAVCAGGYDADNDYRRAIFHDMVAAIEAGVAQNVFRIDHRLHLRCELSDPQFPEDVAPHVDRPLIALASLMDHTPGQRQWRDVAHLKRFMSGEGLSAADADALLAKRMRNGADAAAVNRPLAVKLFRERGLPIASHDDTTLDHVAEAAGEGCAISEFPTTLEAARAAHAAGLSTVGGAPNVVRGGSHSGGVAIAELAREGVLDCLSSDYVPASLLQAVKTLTTVAGLALERAFALVTARPAAMLGMDDRGRLAAGLRADLVRVRFLGDGTPIVRGLTVAGRSAL
ncbi:alpha-D-ribose 1-methylphosphonate 5-triphosphate diphosphatase [Hansschlegelia quercus]|uniref:Alpha-D-ribose 1-methylphosphonate 5-triphosphate diphosphatase n=1 Tax=Hansschlegelia quercus TaxID=2528245 RepID=A0A4V2JDF5_9HYPH|nr:alpha-D-ribose 1-methylphosphonate 5-triphosphate diphosphatase [Hansschlegelia quercus]TBN48624.1 alpha-D-ribose 1-methylphosphonate 5-triphosphate diphosphatase [Hansschlegelia quercus]